METKLTKTVTVEEKMLARIVGSGSLDVLGTPVVAALFENVAMELAAAYLDEGCTTVGSRIEVNHNAPTPLGAKVTVTAELVGHSGRVFDFALRAEDEKGEIATGTHQRVSVGAEKFQARADARRA